jgi:hypothetical protein
MAEQVCQTKKAIHICFMTATDAYAMQKVPASPLTRLLHCFALYDVGRSIDNDSRSVSGLVSGWPSDFTAAYTLLHRHRPQSPLGTFIGFTFALFSVSATTFARGVSAHSSKRHAGQRVSTGRDLVLHHFFASLEDSAGLACRWLEHQAPHSKNAGDGGRGWRSLRVSLRCVAGISLRFCVQSAFGTYVSLIVWSPACAAVGP